MRDYYYVVRNGHGIYTVEWPWTPGVGDRVSRHDNGCDAVAEASRLNRVMLPTPTDAEILDWIELNEANTHVAQVMPSGRKEWSVRPGVGRGSNRIWYSATTFRDAAIAAMASEKGDRT